MQYGLVDQDAHCALVIFSKIALIDSYELHVFYSGFYYRRFTMVVQPELMVGGDHIDQVNQIDLVRKLQQSIVEFWLHRNRC